MLGSGKKSAPLILSFNGERIYSLNTFGIKAPILLGFNGTFAEYIFSGLQAEFDALPDGVYALPTVNLVVSKQGQLGYFDYLHLVRLSDQAHSVQSDYDQNQVAKASNSEASGLFDEKREVAIYRKLFQLLSSARFSPATLADSTKVNCQIFGEDYSLNGLVQVVGHKSFRKELKPKY